MLSRLKSLLGNRNPLRLLYHKAKALIAAIRYGFPARHLTVIGITGTDGKTTTVGMIAHILASESIKVGALSTAFFRINDDIQWNATQKTSPSPFTVQRFLRRCVGTGCTHAVLEYSSHGLVQGRTLFTWPKIAAITNTTPEHLDYHVSMERYRKDKGKLFEMLRGTGVKVLNADDATFEMYRGIPSEETIMYEIGQKQLVIGNWQYDIALWLGDIVVTIKGSTANVHITSHKPQATGYKPISLAIPGTFNLQNALCAIGCTMGCGIDIEESIKALATFPGIPGRMERIDEGQPFSVYVDFTVTPASYRATLRALKVMLPEGKRLLVLTGSCGDRMREKRPEVGRIVSNFADVMVVTNEDPYTEDPEKIISEVWTGIDHTTTKAHRITNRREAIHFLLKEARSGDIVILCGKGSDTTMWVKHGQVPWNEREIVREMLRLMHS